MAEKKAINSLADLRLSAEEREQIADLAGDLIAVQVYRQLQRINEQALAADSSGCNIAGNCCSSGKKELLGLD
jgi:hypothetical protein